MKSDRSGETKKYLTISSDDGSRLDLKLLGFLEKYDLKATFYIPQKYHLRTLSDEEVKVIAQNQEVGGHTLTHPDSLADLNFEQQCQEIGGSKQYLENLLGKEILMFSYPRGIFNDETVRAVKEAGYLGARTVRPSGFDIKDPFRMGVSLQIYPFPLMRKRSDYSYFFWLKKCLKPARTYKKYIEQYDLGWNSYFSWLHLAQNMLDYVLENGGIYHLWGHAWEIEKYGLWNDLERFLEYFKATGARDLICATNGEIIRQLKSEKNE